MINETIEIIKIVVPHLSNSLISTLVLLLFIYYFGRKIYFCIMYRIDKMFIRNEKMREKKNKKIDELQDKFLEVQNNLLEILKDNNKFNNNIRNNLKVLKQDISFIREKISKNNKEKL